MNFQYSAVYDGSQVPTIKKSITASSGEVLEAVIHFSSQEETKEVPTEVIYEHLRNIISYIKSVAETISITEKDDYNLGPWHIKNWEKIEEARVISSSWWNIAYYRDEDQEEPDA